jgi:hypothetical protein
VKIVFKPRIKLIVPPAMGLAVLISLLILLLRWATGAP